MENDLERLLEDISVHPPYFWENDDAHKDWYAVSREDAGGIVAYFRDEHDAFGFRLYLINGLLNPVARKGE